MQHLTSVTQRDCFLFAVPNLTGRLIGFLEVRLRPLEIPSLAIGFTQVEIRDDDSAAVAHFGKQRPVALEVSNGLHQRPSQRQQIT